MSPTWLHWPAATQNAPSFSYIGAVGNSVQQTTPASRSYSISHACVSSSTYLILTGNQSSSVSYNALSGCTVNSVTATLAAQFGTQTSLATVVDRISIAMYTVTGITGSSLTIDTTWTGGNVFRSTVQVYKIDDSSISVHDTATDSGINTDTAGDVTINVPSAGIVFALACGTTIASSPSWGGTLTLDNTTLTNSFIQNMCGSKTGGGNGYSISGTNLTNGASGESFRLLAVSFV